MNKTAILVDGGFYIRKAKKYFGEMSAKEAAAKLKAKTQTQTITKLHYIEYFIMIVRL